MLHGILLIALFACAAFYIGGMDWVKALSFIGESFDGNLRRKHLDDEGNPYNTYKHPGLPPGPICSPGLACLKAAANPEQHDYIYFVARGEDGSHVFSTNLAAHNKAVREYWAKRRGK